MFLASQSPCSFCYISSPHAHVCCSSLIGHHLATTNPDLSNLDSILQASPLTSVHYLVQESVWHKWRYWMEWSNYQTVFSTHLNKSNAQWSKRFKGLADKKGSSKGLLHVFCNRITMKWNVFQTLHEVLPLSYFCCARKWFI